MSRNHTPQFAYPAPRYGPDKIIPSERKGRVSEIHIAAEAITLTFQHTPGLRVGAGRHFSLHLIHRILQSMLRAGGEVRMQGNASDFHGLDVPSQALPLRRILALEPPPQPKNLPATLFHFHLKSATVNLEYAPNYPHREGILIHIERHRQPYQLRVVDEIHAVMRLCELRQGPVRFEAVGFHPSNRAYGQIIHLVGPNQEIIGENPFALGQQSRKGVQA